MRLLRHAWLIAIACGAAIGGVSALVMRAELVDPGPTLSPTIYSHALSLHGLALLGVLIAAFIATPTLVLQPGRRAGVVGRVAFAVWAVAMAVFMTVAFAPDAGFIDSPFTPSLLRLAARGLALGAGVAVAQLVASLPANTRAEHRRNMIAAIGAILALAIVGIPLATGTLPTTLQLTIASTLAVAGVVPLMLGTDVAWIAWRTVVPCLAATWATLWFIGRADDLYVHDTAAMVAPFPVLGGAVIAALFAAAASERTLRQPIAKIAAAMVTGGTVMTSIAFLALGSRGMPRRYWQYTEEFQSLHLLGSAAALVTVAGAIAAVWSMRTAR